MVRRRPCGRRNQSTRQAMYSLSILTPQTQVRSVIDIASPTDPTRETSIPYRARVSGGRHTRTEPDAHSILPAGGYRPIDVALPCDPASALTKLTHTLPSLTMVDHSAACARVRTSSDGSSSYASSATPGAGWSGPHPYLGATMLCTCTSSTYRPARLRTSSGSVGSFGDESASITLRISLSLSPA